jgi:hypothetical protein
MKKVIHAKNQSEYFSKSAIVVIQNKGAGKNQIEHALENLIK